VAVPLWLACSSGPRVSPWGASASVPLRLYVEAPDLGARAQAIDAETAALGLRLERESRWTDKSGVAFVARSYVGSDSLGRTTHACRVASDRGVVLALGPPAESDPGDLATEWVPAVDAGGGRVVASPGDLDADGSFELVVRSRAGTLAIYSLGPQGARALEIQLRAAPTRLVDLGEDGLAVAGDVSGPPPEGSSKSPLLEVVATASPAGFSDRAKAARAHHARERDRLAPAREGETARERADRRLAWAWHALLSGSASKEVFDALSAEPATGSARAELERRIAWLRDAAR
jgi:hypothetical protein